MAAATPVLELKAVTKRFGGLVAVDGLTFRVERGEVRALIGPNGAGKTTVFNLITAVHPLDEGEILMDGRRTHGLPSHRVAELGVARTFQNVKLFDNMSVLENVMVGAHTRSRAGLVSASLRLPGLLAEERRLAGWAKECLDLAGLGHLPADRPASALAFGEQRLLEVARALASKPKLLLLDEPAAGLSSSEAARLSDLVERIRDLEVTVLLVDHDMDLVMQISDSVVVLDSGEKISAYLGEES
jgi:branched-chain amino acid transport system ATP-binding protein